MTDPSRVRVTGPLDPFAAGFASELSRQGYTSNAARLQMQLMAHLSRWLADRELDPRGLCAVEVERFLADRRAAGYTNHRTCKGIRPVLSYLRQLGVAPTPPPSVPNGPLDLALERYRHYLTVERGLTRSTVRGYLDAVRPFLCCRVSSDGVGLDLDHLSARDVTAFVVARCSRQGRGAAKLTVTALRSLLGFLHIEGAIERPLAVAVPSVAGWRLARLPKGLEPAQVRSLLASCDRRTRNGRRDFAIMTMLVRLGLRAGEVIALALDDIDWRAGEIIVHGKGNRAERLPLPIDVGEAMAAYLRRGRPASAEGRKVFVRVRAPHRALSTGGVTQIVVAAARRAGLGQICAHRLRHTAATQLLRAGASLPEIGQLLRHRRALTTAIYAKVDRSALRTIARRWPGGVA
ncbi:MAG TPA: site-specific integrase [Thermoanaerobaculia bacterium]|nr:site-specific integrase [Thermoanaerobaculia bacterium]